LSAAFDGCSSVHDLFLPLDYVPWFFTGFDILTYMVCVWFCLHSISCASFSYHLHLLHPFQFMIRLRVPVVTPTVWAIEENLPALACNGSLSDPASRFVLATLIFVLVTLAILHETHWFLSINNSCAP
jgi:hypothetical protein